MMEGEMVTELEKWKHLTAKSQEAIITVMSGNDRGTAKS